MIQKMVYRLLWLSSQESGGKPSINREITFSQKAFILAMAGVGLSMIFTEKVSQSLGQRQFRIMMETVWRKYGSRLIVVCSELGDYTLICTEVLRKRQPQALGSGRCNTASISMIRTCPVKSLTHFLVFGCSCEPSGLFVVTPATMKDTLFLNTKGDPHTTCLHIPQLQIK